MFSFSSYVSAVTLRFIHFCLLHFGPFTLSMGNGKQACFEVASGKSLILPACFILLSASSRGALDYYLHAHLDVFVFYYLSLLNGLLLCWQIKKTPSCLHKAWETWGIPEQLSRSKKLLADSSKCTRLSMLRSMSATEKIKIKNLDFFSLKAWQISKKRVWNSLLFSLVSL